VRRRRRARHRQCGGSFAGADVERLLSCR
jgi:hypothetical protein